MRPDEVAFENWLNEFEQMLIESGMPAPQAQAFRTKYRTDSVNYFRDGFTPALAVQHELLND